MIYKYSIKNFFKHLNVVNKHRFKVFCLCVKAGQPWRGLLHDLSKYSPTEFFEGVKYFSGDRSPIVNCKKEIGYSEAWLHHTGRNKHHFEYWYDSSAPMSLLIISYPYFVEMVCDCLAAGMIYQGKKWNQHYQLSYWNKIKDNVDAHPKMKKLLTRVYTDVSEYGVDNVISSKNLRKLYDEYTK